MRAHTITATLLASVLAILWFGAGAASAASTDYVLTSNAATIDETGDNPSIAITLINLTDSPATATLTTTEGGDNCSPSQEELQARQQNELKFVLSGCDFGDEGVVGFRLNVEGVAFDIPAKNGETGNPNWGLLWYFVWSLGGAAVLVVVGWISFLAKPPASLTQQNNLGPLSPLPYLGATWSFKDSWAANVTLVSAVFTGIFGSSDLLKSVAGAEAPFTLAVVTIASAVGVAMVGIGPLVLQALRNDKAEVLSAGLFLSAVLAVGAAGGVTLIIIRSVEGLVTGPASNTLWIGGVAALLLLAVYTVTSVRQNLILGLTKPPSKEEGQRDAEKQKVIDQVRTMLDEEISDDAVREDVFPAIEGIISSSYPRTGTSPGDYPAALL